MAAVTIGDDELRKPTLVDEKHKSQGMSKKTKIILALPLILVLLPVVVVLGGITAMFYMVFCPRKWTNFKRDIGFVKLMAGGGIKIKKLAKLNQPGEWNAIHVFYDGLSKYGDKTHLICDDREFTFKQVNVLSNQVANWAIQQGFKQGDTVALDIVNSPEFIFVFIGMMKIGVTSALINTNITGKGLAHCVAISGAKRVIFCHDTAPMMEGLANSPDGTGFEYFCIAEASKDAPFGTSMDWTKSSDGEIAHKYRNQIKNMDLACHIYTSGTTGLPKAARIPHLRLMAPAVAFGGLLNINDTDRMYNVLPLYHTAGLAIGYLTSWAMGNGVIIRKKFSASKFWEDCHRHRATTMIYIGELLRYLVNTLPGKYDKDHNVRLAMGNGLRPEVWDKFVDRFNVPNIVEYYGATEGNAVLINNQNKVGAIGFLSPLLKKAIPSRIIKFNIETEEPIRGPDGFCMECDEDEPGEFIGRIEHDNPSRRFDGYSDAKASKKKVLRDVFVKGDQYFRSGDLVKYDRDHFVYFIDRIGDTFRWKGENCSTAEVSTVVSSAPHNMVEETVIYGMSISGYDGRCGMALIKPNESFDAAKLYQHISGCLPAYAVPVFLRISPKTDVEITGTFKHRKVTLVKEGFDPSALEDQIMVIDRVQKTYREVDADLYKRINDGVYKL